MLIHFLLILIAIKYFHLYFYLFQQNVSTRQDNYSSCWHITRNSRYSTCGKNPDPRFVWLWMLNYFMLIFIFTNYFCFSFFFNLAKCECYWNNYKTSCWHTTRQRHTDMQPVALKLLLLLLLRLILWVVLIALMKCIT